MTYVIYVHSTVLRHSQSSFQAAELHAQSFAVVLTDFNMAGMNGIMLLQERVGRMPLIHCDEGRRHRGHPDGRIAAWSVRIGGQAAETGSRRLRWFSKPLSTIVSDRKLLSCVER